MPKLILDSKTYEIPSLDELSLGEGIMFERYAGLTIGEFEQRTADQLPLSVAKALSVIAMLRARKDVSEHEASLAIDAIPITKLREAFPKDEAKTPLAQSPAESEGDDSPGPSGTTSNGDGDPLPDSAIQEPSGDQASEPSGSVLPISAA